MAKLSVEVELHKLSLEHTKEEMYRDYTSSSVKGLYDRSDPSVKEGSLTRQDSRK